jgi:hypothetical protein
MDRTVDAIAGKQRKNSGQESRKLIAAHLAAAHHEVIVPNRAQTTDIALDPDVAWAINERRRGPLCSHRILIRSIVQRVATKNCTVA